MTDFLKSYAGKSANDPTVEKDFPFLVTNTDDEGVSSGYYLDDTGSWVAGYLQDDKPTNVVETGVGPINANGLTPSDQAELARLRQAESDRNATDAADLARLRAAHTTPRPLPGPHSGADEPSDPVSIDTPPVITGETATDDNTGGNA